MKLFKIIASKAGRVVFDDRVQAESPREAREQMKTLTGLQSLSGVVYAVTEIPVELIQSIVDARVAEAVQRLQSGQPPEGMEAMIRPIAGEEIRQQLATLRDQISAISTPAPASASESPRRYDAFTAATEVPVEDHTLGGEVMFKPRRNGASRAVKATKPGASAKLRTPRPAETTDGRRIDWRAVKRLYRQNRSHKQTAAHFELSVNSVKARCRREGWGA
jgi:hypothetical protein